MDISRTISRAALPAATGIDRVERAYILWALDRGALFLARTGRRYFLLGPGPVLRLVAWLDGDAPAPAPYWRRFLRPHRDSCLVMAEALVRRDALASGPLGALAAMAARALPEGGAYLNVGHANLSAPIMRALASAGLARAVLIHDLIPLDHPAYTRPGTPERFRALLGAALRAEAILVNSHATAARLHAHAAAPPPVTVAPLGVERLDLPRVTPPPAPRFLCIGTIEPRKNHALLLDLWEEMQRTRRPEAIPHLVLIGRRGWANEAVFRRLDRSPVMGTTVHEAGAVDDAALARLMAGAKAVLFPSFAEGFGLPLAESLAAGVPVIAADLPALRETGGDVPDYLGPDDPAAWQAMIDAYAAPGSPVRAAQEARLAAWSPPTWDDHFAIVDNVLETILVQSGRGG